MSTPLTTRLLDTTVSAGPGLRSRIVERPGLGLAPADLAALVEDVRSIARSVLSDGDLTYGIFSGDPETLSRTVLTVVYEKKSGRPVAFNALAVLDADLSGRSVEILHLGLVMVRPDVRGGGLSATLYGLTCVLLFVRKPRAPDLSNGSIDRPVSRAVACPYGSRHGFGSETASRRHAVLGVPTRLQSRRGLAL